MEGVEWDFMGLGIYWDWEIWEIYGKHHGMICGPLGNPLSMEVKTASKMEPGHFTEGLGQIQ